MIMMVMVMVMVMMMMMMAMMMVTMAMNGDDGLGVASPPCGLLWGASEGSTFLEREPCDEVKDFPPPLGTGLIHAHTHTHTLARANQGQAHAD